MLYSKQRGRDIFTEFEWSLNAVRDILLAYNIGLKNENFRISGYSFIAWRRKADFAAKYYQEVLAVNGLSF